MVAQFSFASGSMRIQEQNKLTGSSVRCLRDTDPAETRYTIRGAFGAAATRATLTICNSQLLLGSDGVFAKQSIPLGTNCDTMKLEKAGYDCHIVEAPTSEIRDNFELHGSCTEKAFYSVKGNF